MDAFCLEAAFESLSTPGLLQQLILERALVESGTVLSLRQLCDGAGLSSRPEE